jgi:hypothetical protein
MSLSPKRLSAIRDIIRDRMIESGVDNYAFVDGQLQIGSTRYAVDVCGCGEADCDGLRLRRVQSGFPVCRPEMDAGFSLGSASGTA